MSLDLKNDATMLAICCDLILESPFGANSGGWCPIIRSSNTFAALMSIGEEFNIDIELDYKNADKGIMMVKSRDVNIVKEFCAKTLDMLRL